MVAIAGSGCKGGSEGAPLPPLSEAGRKQIETTLELVKTAAPEARSGQLALALSEAERGRLPDSLVRGLASIAGASLELSHKETILLRSIEEPDWTYACAGGWKVYQSVAGNGLDHQQRADQVFRHCGMSELGWLTEDEVKAANSVYLMAGLVAFQSLHKRGAMSNVESSALTQFVLSSQKDSSPSNAIPP